MGTAKSKKLERLIKRRNQLAARIQAAKNRSRSSAFKKDTRRKIIVGRFFQRKHIFDSTESDLLSLLDPYLERSYDRNIFCLDDDNDVDLSELPTRGIILIGALYLSRYEDQPMALLKEIEPMLNSRQDRELFGLEYDPNI